MNIRNTGLSMVVCAVLVGPWLMSGCSNDEPSIQCQVGHATAFGYAATYKLRTSTGKCAAPPSKGDTIGLDDYHPLSGPDNIDITQTTVYIQTSDEFTAQQVSQQWSAPDSSTGYKGGPFTDSNKAHTIWAEGKFTAVLPDGSDFCYLTDLTSAEQDIPAIPATKANINPAPGADLTTQGPGAVSAEAPTGYAPNPAANCSNPDGMTFNFSCQCPNPVTTQPCTKQSDCKSTQTCNMQGFCEDPPPDNCCDTVPGNCTTECKTDADCCYPSDFDCKGDAPTGLCDMKAKTCLGHIACNDDRECCEKTLPKSQLEACQQQPTKGICDTTTHICNDAADGCDGSQADACCDPADAGCKAPAKGTSCVTATGPDPKSCHTATQPAFSLKYTWSNVKLYTTAAAAGTQLSAQLVYQNDSCVETYDVVAVWPAVDCTLTDASGNPLKADGKTPLGAGEAGVPNPLACCPNADTAHGHPSGSQINSDFQVKCDPDLLLCVLDPNQPIPQLDTQGYPTGCQPPVPLPDAE